MHRLRSPWIVVLVLVVGAGATFVLWHGGCHSYRYLNRDIACSGPQAVGKANYLTLQNDITDYIHAATASSTVSEVAVYFRDLKDGPTFGVNASDAFAPASLLKLPIAMALFELSEEHPNVLDMQVLYDKAALQKQFSIPEQINYDFTGETLQDGNTYSVRDLMQASVTYSDNTAYYALIKFINEQYPGGVAYVGKALQELGVIDPRTPEEQTVTVRDYASLFRLLYNASYLNAADSQELLGWLAASTYDAGLVAGVPAGTVVANKFGERQEGTDKTLHDCGIVYYPDNPYTLCIMTKGSDWGVLKKTIADVSRMVYQAVDSRAR